MARFIQQNVHPLDIVFRLAHDHGIVQLYDDIGRAIRAIAQDYVPAYRAAQQAGSMPTVREPAWPKEAMQ